MRVLVSYLVLAYVSDVAMDLVRLAVNTVKVLNYISCIERVVYHVGMEIGAVHKPSQLVSRQS